MSDLNQSGSDWPLLFRVACSLIDQVNEDQCVIDDWSLGGGTAMMLQIDHRESHDIDIFFEDPQFLPFLSPDTHDFSYEIMPSEYKGDGVTNWKFAFEKIGQIDFIVAPHLTANPTIQKDVEGISVLLETVPEIITKKIYYRGSRITPRDIFDLAAAGKVNPQVVVTALADYQDKVRACLSYIEGLNPVFVEAAISGLMIHEHFTGLVKTSLDDAKALLLSVA